MSGLITRRKVRDTLCSIYRIFQNKMQVSEGPCHEKAMYAQGYERALQMLCLGFDLPADAFSDSRTPDHVADLNETLYLEDVRGTIESTWKQATSGPELPEDDSYREGFNDAFEALRIRLGGQG